MNTTIPLVLASASKVRSEILTNIKLTHEIILSDFDEDAMKEDIASLPLKEQAACLAQGKAENVSRKHRGKLILAADQICEFGGQAISKSKNIETAIAQLSKLQGKVHYQHSGACLYLGGELLWQIVKTAELKMRELKSSEIEKYISLDEPFGSCGSYMLEKHGKHLFERIDGNDDVIKGLPSVELLSFLYGSGFLVL